MSKSAELVTEIFQVKIGLSPKLINDTFNFIKKLHFLRITAASRSDNPNGKIRHRNKKIWLTVLFPNEHKAII